MEGTGIVTPDQQEGVDLTVRTLDNTIDLQSYQPEWEALRKRCGGSIFVSFDWVIEWLRHFDRTAQPRVVLVEENGELVGLAPFVVSEERSKGMKVRRLSLVGNGEGLAKLHDLSILVCEDRPNIMDKIVEEMDRLDWNVLHFGEMQDCPSTRGLYARIRQRWDAEELSTIPCPGTDLSLGRDLLDVVSSRTRRTIRRTITELEEESRVRYRCVDTPVEAAEATEMYALKHLTSRDEDVEGVFHTRNLANFLKDAMMASVQEGQAMVFEVWIDGSLASQMLCLEDRDVMRAFKVGSSDRFVEHSPNNLVAIFAMNEARHAGFVRFDFGAGAEEFKYRLGARDRYLLVMEARRGTVRAMAKLSSLPGVRQLVDRKVSRQQALKTKND